MAAMFSAGGSSTATILPVDGPERLIFRRSISDVTVLSTATSPGSGDHYHIWQNIQGGKTMFRVEYRYSVEKFCSSMLKLVDLYC